MNFLKVLIWVALAVLAVALYRHPSFISSFWIEPDMPVITFNEKTPLRVTVVEKEEERMRGLSGRESLEPTEGMLFIFPQSGYHSFWMKEMRFPIDIIWVGEDGTIVDIAPVVRPETYPKAFEPKAPARYVIEASAYFTQSFGISVGDTVQIPARVLPDDLH
jgi:uncharacterized protein